MDYIKENIKKNKKIYDKIFKKIEEYDTIVIFRHISPDFDAFGCQFGLETWLKENFKDKTIKVVGDNHPSFSNRLFPEIKKTSDKFLTENKFLALLCDVGDFKRVCDDRITKASYVIKIDHHPSNEKIFDLGICEPEKSSCSEMVAAMLFYFNKYKTVVSKKCAHYLYTGMVGDNGRFMFNSTSSFTFNIAAMLLETKIDIVSIYESMYQKELRSLNFMKFVLDNYKLSKLGVAYYVVTKEDQDKLGLESEEVKEHVNLFSTYNGIKIWCSISEDITEPCFRISLRSRNYKIDGVAKKYQGGGHEQAAGCQIPTLDKLDDLIKDLEEVIKEGDK